MPVPIQDLECLKQSPRGQISAVTDQLELAVDHLTSQPDAGNFSPFRKSGPAYGSRAV